MERHISAKIGQCRARATPSLPVDADLFQPTRARPVRVRTRTLPVDAHFEPHRHAWAQVAYCAAASCR